MTASCYEYSKSHTLIASNLSLLLTTFPDGPQVVDRCGGSGLMNILLFCSCFQFDVLLVFLQDQIAILLAGSDFLLGNWTVEQKAEEDPVTNSILHDWPTAGVQYE